MEILVIGTPSRIKDFQVHNWQEHKVKYHFIPESIFTEDLNQYDVVFHLNLDDTPLNIKDYIHLKGKFVVVSATKKSLHQMIFAINKKPECYLLGINCLPTFLSRKVWEFSAFMPQSIALWQEKFQNFPVQIAWVADQVGMVSLRVLAAIINEAYWLVQEKNANEKDIDNAMRLGTNYPLGPIEWGNIIGLNNIYDILVGLQEEFGKERFPIAPILKNKSFI
ncbi:MAG: 3-hydroxyacyl-CoA dehydrogenase family protein [Bacteroidia bacterium]|nr:3-hydroxyacyl-CoA dehydrogenase family protein [Bacteroidia bacterium]MDW8158408.1 3-hydroxyacyl-CoA dehydrogenase family protein [Bacteroidia bacterium]